MKVTIEYDVTHCSNCPYVFDHDSHSECWAECTHKETGRKWYDMILYGCNEQMKPVPEWCPLGIYKEE